MRLPVLRDISAGIGRGLRGRTGIFDTHETIVAVSTPPDTLVRAWLEAAEDLSVAVIAPYAVSEQVFIALVGGFGGRLGTVVDWQASGNETASVAADGYHVSVVNLQSYGLYDADLFRETLDDWGWHGDPEHQPRWYTGRPHTH